MAEYIDRQKLLEKAKSHLNSPFGAALIIAEIENAFTALRSGSMDVAELRKSLNSIYDDVSDADFNDKYQIKEALFRLIRFNEDLVAKIEKVISQ